MVAKAKPEPYEAENTDPDHWIFIPDFGINPRDVDFEGFKCPLINKTAKGQDLRNIIHQQVRTARTFIRKQELTMDEVYTRSNQFQEAMSIGQIDKTNSLISTHAMSFMYRQSIRSAHFAFNSSFGKLAPMTREQMLSECYTCIAICATSIALMADFAFSQNAVVNTNEIRSLFGRSGALGRLAKDPKQMEKKLVRECWDTWQIRPNNYPSKAAFARDMLEKYVHLESQPAIETWCRQWERETQSLIEPAE